MSAPDPASPPPWPRGRIFVGLVHVVAGALTGYGVFRALPARVLVVDVGGAAATLLLVASGALLLARHPRARDVARAASFGVLALGLLSLTVVAGAATALRAAYGSLGGGAMPVLVLLGALPFAYLVLLPAASLLWLGPRRAPPRGAGDDP